MGPPIGVVPMKATRPEGQDAFLVSPVSNCSVVLLRDINETLGANEHERHELEDKCRCDRWAKHRDPEGPRGDRDRAHSFRPLARTTTPPPRPNAAVKSP
jgi:hypothetical protein